MCNEVTGLVGRVLGVVPVPTDYGISRLKAAAKRLKHWLRAHTTDRVLTYDEVISRYSGPKRKRYEKARDSLLVEPLQARDAHVTAFVKAEKRLQGDLKDPRIIQFRSFRYTLELARRLIPLEHALLGFKGNTRVPCRSRVIAKGLDTWEHAALIKFKMSQFSEPCVIPLDAARWDKHVHQRALAVEHGVWLHALADDVLRELLGQQLANRGRTKSGIKYRVLGNRMSGDYNTGCGNCVLMLLGIEGLMHPLKIMFDYLINSDDGLIFIERRDLELVMSLVPEAFLGYGHEVVVEDPVYEMEDIVHCQQRPVCINGRWRMVRDFRKVISTWSCSHRHFHEPRGGAGILKGIAQAELSLSTGLPILQPYFSGVIEKLAGVKERKLDYQESVAYRASLESHGGPWKLGLLEVTPGTVASFCRAFGVTPEEIESIEASLDAVSHSAYDLSRMLAPGVHPHSWPFSVDGALTG